MLAAVGATILTNSDKIGKVAGAITSLDAQGWTWFGLACEGGGRRNAMSICNGTNHDIELVRTYLHWGKCKVPADAYIASMRQDDCLFHNAGSWAATGSSGIVTYKLQHNTNLHIMWDCPFNFDYSDNFIGLMLTSKPALLNPDETLFKNMYQDWKDLNLTPEKESTYDLVCCGPGKAGSKDVGGKECWGYGRPCKVCDGHYMAFATMGDRHATTSKITILNNEA